MLMTPGMGHDEHPRGQDAVGDVQLTAAPALQVVQLHAAAGAAPDGRQQGDEFCVCLHDT